MNIIEFPDEIKCIIIELLPFFDAFKLSLVCRNFFYLIQGFKNIQTFCNHLHVFCRNNIWKSYLQKHQFSMDSLNRLIQYPYDIIVSHILISNVLNLTYDDYEYDSESMNEIKSSFQDMFEKLDGMNIRYELHSATVYINIIFKDKPYFYKLCKNKEKIHYHINLKNTDKSIMSHIIQYMFHDHPEEFFNKANRVIYRYHKNFNLEQKSNHEDSIILNSSNFIPIYDYHQYTSYLLKKILN